MSARWVTGLLLRTFAHLPIPSAESIAQQIWTWNAATVPLLSPAELRQQIENRKSAARGFTLAEFEYYWKLAIIQCLLLPECVHYFSFGYLFYSCFRSLWRESLFRNWSAGISLGSHVTWPGLISYLFVYYGYRYITRFQANAFGYVIPPTSEVHVEPVQEMSFILGLLINASSLIGKLTTNLFIMSVMPAIFYFPSHMDVVPMIVHSIILFGTVEQELVNDKVFLCRKIEDLFFNPWTYRLSDFMPVNSDFKLGFLHQFLKPNDIRLIKICKIRRANLPTCRLIHVSVDQNLSYEAISYNWGATDLTHEVVVNNQHLRITKSAYDVLEGYRKAGNTAWIWIDSICIDQQNVSEKNHQLKLMPRIYGKAVRVVAWLKPCKVRSEIKNGATAIKALLEAQGEDVHTHFPDFEQMEAVSQLHAALSELLHNPWFERIWIIQEIAFARKVELIYEGLMFNWAEIVGLMTCLMGPQRLIPFIESSNMPPGIWYARCMQRLRDDVRAGRERSFMEIFACCRKSRATFPEDHILALLSTCTDELPSYLKIGFQFDALTNYSELAWYLAGDAEYLTYILPLAGKGYRRCLKGLPSWMPDWSSVPLANPLADRVVDRDIPQGYYQYQSSGIHAANIKLLDPSTLSIRGLFIDTISHTSPRIKADNPVPGPRLNLWTKGNTRANCIKEIFSSMPPTYLDPQTSILHPQHWQVLWRTLLGDRCFAARPLPLDFEQLFLDYVKAPSPQMKHVQRMRDREIQDPIARRNMLVRLSGSRADALMEAAAGAPPPGPLLPEPHPETLTTQAAGMAFNRAAYGRRFCTTEVERFGLVPPRSRKGDLICIFAGAETPFVLRRVGEREVGATAGKKIVYELIGECYLHGVMDGEAVRENVQWEDVIVV